MITVCKFKWSSEWTMLQKLSVNNNLRWINWKLQEITTKRSANVCNTGLQNVNMYCKKSLKAGVEFHTSLWDKLRDREEASLCNSQRSV